MQRIEPVRTPEGGDLDPFVISSNCVQNLEKLRHSRIKTEKGSMRYIEPLRTPEEGLEPPT